MAEQTFHFTAGTHDIRVSLQIAEEGNVIFEQLNPWSENHFAAVIPAEQFTADMESLLPDHVEENPDTTLYPRLLETLTAHVKKYGVLADSDYCTYVNYYYLLRHHLASITGAETISEEDQKGAMLGFYQWLKEQNIPVETTSFRDL